jgi:hypothetical protein
MKRCQSLHARSGHGGAAIACPLSEAKREYLLSASIRTLPKAALSSLESVRQPVEKCRTYLLTDACQFDIRFWRRGIKRLRATNLRRQHLSYAMVSTRVI